jgi:hypothetical protein
MKIEIILNLRKAIGFAETELGLEKLSNDERDIIYGILSVVDDYGYFQSSELKQSGFIQNTSHASYQRHLKDLLRKKFISKAKDRKRDLYLLNLPLEFSK